MKKIRVIRILQYTYRNAEDMSEDMAHWAVPANGAHARGWRAEKISSATLPIDFIDELPGAGKTEETNE